MSHSYGVMEEYKWYLDAIIFNFVSDENIDPADIESIDSLVGDAEINSSQKKKGSEIEYREKSKMSGIDSTHDAEIEFERVLHQNKIEWNFSVSDITDKYYSHEEFSTISRKCLDKISFSMKRFFEKKRIIRVAFSAVVFPDVVCKENKDTVQIAKTILPFVGVDESYEVCDLKFARKASFEGVLKNLPNFNQGFSVSSVTFFKIKDTGSADVLELKLDNLRQVTCLLRIDLNTDKKSENPISDPLAVQYFFINSSADFIHKGARP